jgi:hypothetical protein
MVINVWTVTYVNDEVADDFGSRIFATQAEAEAWEDRYLEQNDPDSDGCEGRTHFTTIEHHEMTVTLRVGD